MKKASFIILSVFIFLCGYMAIGQSVKGKFRVKPFRVAFYNTENLFDTIDDPATNDAEFLPDSRIAWNSDRYDVKLEHTAKVIRALADPKPVAAFGLCEVENRHVLEDLVHSRSIRKFHYQIIHIDSPDERGIDNALLYDPDQFLPVSIRAIPIDLSFVDNDKTRDILYIKGIPVKHSMDTLHIFVNHWPSRWGGKEKSESKRILAALVMKHVADSLTALPGNHLILIMGDFNDEPADKSLSVILGALAPTGNLDNKKLYNLGFPAFQSGKGTIYYKDWDVFDQFIVNGYFFSKNQGLKLIEKDENIFAPEWLMFKDNDGNLRPNRTAGQKYYGGYSDHLPVYLDLVTEQ